MKIRTGGLAVALFLMAALLPAQQTPKPIVPQDGIVNGASFASGPIAPGSIVSIFGTNLGLQLVNGSTAPISATATQIPLATSLGGHSVRFSASNGQFDAPLFFVSGAAGQMNAQVPWQLAGQQQAQMVVRVQGGGTSVTQSDPVTVQVGAASPGIFVIGSRAVAVNVKLAANDDVIGGSFAQEAGAIPGVENQPAAIGGVITLYVNGLGLVSPAIETGHAAPSAAGSPLSSTNEIPTVTVDDRPTGSNISTPRQAEVLFSGLAPGFVGLYQVNLVIPEGVTPRNDVAVRMSISNATSPPNVTIAVRAKP